MYIFRDRELVREDVCVLENVVIYDFFLYSFWCASSIYFTLLRLSEVLKIEKKTRRRCTLIPSLWVSGTQFLVAQHRNTRTLFKIELKNETEVKVRRDVETINDWNERKKTRRNCHLRLTANEWSVEATLCGDRAADAEHGWRITINCVSLCLLLSNI